VVLIAPPNRARHLARQVGDLLAATTAGAEVLGVLAHDEAGADALGGRGRGRVDKALLTRSARELAGTLAHRYGLLRPAPAAAVPAPAPTMPGTPIAPTAVHPAAAAAQQAMPQNLTSVPHPAAQQHQSPYPHPGGRPAGYPRPDAPRDQHPYPPTVNGTVA